MGRSPELWGTIIDTELAPVRDALANHGIFAYISVHADNLRQENWRATEAGASPVWSQMIFDSIQADYDALERALKLLRP